jgi:hypothetical protein
MPYQPSLEFDRLRELEGYADQKRADLYWWSQPWTVSLQA